jgi:hypothetical protein
MLNFDTRHRWLLPAFRRNPSGSVQETKAYRLLQGNRIPNAPRPRAPFIPALSAKTLDESRNSLQAGRMRGAIRAARIVQLIGRSRP